MIDVGKPIRTFCQTLLQWGFAFDIDDAGGLVVTLPPSWKETCTGGCPPLLQEAIVGRARWLVQLVELDKLLGRPLTIDEVDRVPELASALGAELTTWRLQLGDQAAGFGEWRKVKA